VTILDYDDIFLHFGFAVLVLTNGAFWIQREYFQHRTDPRRLFTSPQVFLEWFVPAVGAPLVLYAVWSLLT
jgi:hypothetical protein